MLDSVPLLLILTHYGVSLGLSVSGASCVETCSPSSCWRWVETLHGRTFLSLLASTFSPPFHSQMMRIFKKLLVDYIWTQFPPTRTTIKSQLVFIFLQGNAWVHSLTLVKWQTWQAAQEAKLPEELEFIALALSCHETNKQIDAVALWHIWQHR